MSLPSNYVDTETYFRNVAVFLKNHRYFVSYPNTHVLVEGLLDQVPSHWRMPLEQLAQNTENFNKLPRGYFEEEWPDDLKEFIEKLENFKPRYEINVHESLKDLPKEFFKGLSLKKEHEIVSFAPLIRDIVGKVDAIIDIGAGLGYLSQLLYKIYNYKVLAIEADEAKLKSAIKRQKELFVDSENNVRYVQHYVDETSSQSIHTFLCDFLKRTDLSEVKVCFVGLHACADLTVTFLRLFHKMAIVDKAIVMPCCYHRLNMIPGENTYRNFPVSSCLRGVYKELNGEMFLNGPFLRLACQNSAECWRRMTKDEHLKHAVNGLRRNILQLVAERENYHLSRMKRKSKKATSSDESFASYLNGLKETHKLVHVATSRTDLLVDGLTREKLTLAWEKHKNDCLLFEVFSGFQTSLQCLCENIVLLDRVMMVREWGLSCVVRKTVDDLLSPRCYALVARKQSTTTQT